MEIRQPFSNVQLELLKLFSTNISEEELEEVKRILAAYKMQKAIEAADKLWDKEGWSNEKIQELLHTHMRTPYKK